MNRQNSFKIILITVMILVIGIIGIFSYVNREQISAKFKTAVAKSENIERYERNTVPTSPSNPNLANNEDTNQLNKTEDTPILTDKSISTPANLDKKVTNKEDDPFGVGLEDPENPMLDAKTPSSKVTKEKNGNKIVPPVKNFYPENTESDTPESTNKSAKLTSKKYNYAKAYKKKKRKISYKGLERRISKLEKRLGVKKKSKKKVSLEKRVSRLEKIVKKKK